MAAAQNPEGQNADNTYEHLFKIFDSAIRDLNAAETLNMYEISEILLEGVAPTLLNMHKGEVPADIRDFFESWLALHDNIETAEAAMLPSGSDQEVLKFQVDKFNRLAAMMESVREWIVEKSPRSIPPLVIFFALAMYSHAIYLNRLNMDRTLFGDDLPDKFRTHPDDAHDDPEDDPGEEDEDEEPDEDIT